MSLSPALIQSAATSIELEDFSTQEAIFVQYIMRGVPVATAGKQAGLSEKQSGEKFWEPKVQKMLAYLRETYFTEQVAPTRDMLNMMLFELYHERGNSNEGVNVVKEMRALNGLGAPQRVEHTHLTPDNAKSARRLSDEELYKHAGYDEPIDGEFYEIGNESED